MSWFKFDDNAVDHPKLASLTDRAFRWWVKGLSYASRFLTDGVLHPVFWKQVPKQSRAELTGAHLWDWDDPNFLIHDYLHHQIGKQEIEQDKERNREKAKAYRERRRGERRKSTTPAVTGNDTGDVTDSLAGDVTDQITDIHNPTPDPTPNTQQTSKEGVPSAPRPPVPIINRQENVHWAKKHGYHVTGFCDWVCLDEEQAREFAAKIPGDDHPLKARQVREWALDVRRRWADQIVPDGSHFDFWRNRWTETHGGSRPANATLKAVKADRDLDEAFR